MHDLSRCRFEITQSTDLRAPEWDDFLGAVPAVHFEQTSGWGAVKSRYGWKVLRLIAREGGQVVGGIQVLKRRIGRFWTIGYVCRGPVVLPGLENLMPELVSLLEQIAARERWLYLVFDYPYKAHDLASDMAARGYSPHPEGIPPSSLMSATVLVHLHRPEKEILAQMRKRSRRNIETATTSKLSAGFGGPEDLPRFRELMEVICARRGSAPTPPQKDFFKHLWTELHQRDWVKLFVVRKGAEMVCSTFAFTISDTVRVWKVGWSGEYKDDCPNHLLYWEVMRWGNAHGFKDFDFVWVHTGDAKLAAAGETDAAKFSDGTSSFKLGFGGELLMLPPVQSRFFHPLARTAFQCGGEKVLASRWFKYVLSRYWSTTSQN